MELHKVFYKKTDSYDNVIISQTRLVVTDREEAIAFAADLAKELNLMFNTWSQDDGTEDVYTWSTAGNIAENEIVIYQRVKDE